MWHFLCMFKNVQSFLPPKCYLQDVFPLYRHFYMSGYHIIHVILQLIRLMNLFSVISCLFSVVFGVSRLFSVIRYTVYYRLLELLFS